MFEFSLWKSVIYILFLMIVELKVIKQVVLCVKNLQSNLQNFNRMQLLK